jgi:hypothetical protein
MNRKDIENILAYFRDQHVITMRPGIGNQWHQALANVTIDQVRDIARQAAQNARDRQLEITPTDILEHIRQTTTTTTRSRLGDAITRAYRNGTITQTQYDQHFTKHPTQK